MFSSSFAMGFFASKFFFLKGERRRGGAEGGRAGVGRAGEGGPGDRGKCRKGERGIEFSSFIHYLGSLEHQKKKISALDRLLPHSYPSRLMFIVFCVGSYPK